MGTKTPEGKKKENKPDSTRKVVKGFLGKDSPNATEKGEKNEKEVKDVLRAFIAKPDESSLSASSKDKETDDCKFSSDNSPTTLSSFDVRKSADYSPSTFIVLLSFLFKAVIILLQVAILLTLFIYVLLQFSNQLDISPLFGSPLLEELFLYVQNVLFRISIL